MRSYYLSFDEKIIKEWRAPHQLKSRLKAIRSLIKLNKKLWPDFRTPEIDIYG